MKMNLKKTLVATTILSTSVATLGLSFFIVGGYGNNINSLSEIQNSGFFGLNTAYAKEKTDSINSKTEYVNRLKVILETEAAKKDTPEYNKMKEEVAIAEQAISKLQSETLAPLRAAVKKAKEDFEKNRTEANKEAWNLAIAALDASPANGLIAAAEALINKNNQILTKINQSKDDISRLNNYETWNALFITGSTLLAIGSITAIASLSYSAYFKKKEKMATK